jgi:hypothetical protein
MPVDTSNRFARLSTPKLVAAGALLAGAAGAGAVGSAKPQQQPVRNLAFVIPAQAHRTTSYRNLWRLAGRPARRPVRHNHPVHHTTQASSGASHGYTIPASIVMCESGGNYSAVNPSSGAGGAYQILPSTWAAYGGSGLPENAPPAEQDAIAAKIYAAGGPSQWSCG